MGRECEMLAQLAELIWVLIRWQSGNKMASLDRWDFMPAGTIKPDVPKHSAERAEAAARQAAQAANTKRR